MNLELFHYIHCPYCVRVRLALGVLGKTWKSTVLPYNDEATPVKLTGKKMLPIMKIDGVPMNESLDIINAIDSKNLLRNELVQTAEWPKLDEVISKLGQQVHNLAMPYWVWTPEFDDASREYFIAKKSVKRGPFDVLRSKRSTFEAILLADLHALSPGLRPFWHSNELTILDIVLAAQLWGLFQVPEFRFPDVWHTYLMKVKELCHFEHHADYWRST